MRYACACVALGQASPGEGNGVMPVLGAVAGVADMTTGMTTGNCGIMVGGRAFAAAHPTSFRHLVSSVIPFL